jgi:phosphate transport system permease protein
VSLATGRDSTSSTSTTTPRSAAPRPAPRPVRRRPSDLTPADLITGVACVVSALSLSWIIFGRLVDGVGWFPFVLVTYLVFLGMYALATADRLGRLVATDRVVTVLIATAAFILLIPLLWLVGFVVVKGIPALRASFFVHDQSGVTASDPSTAGGGSHALVGTLQQVGLALLISVPLGLATAVFLNETESRLRRPVRVFVDAMSGLPSVVAGLFIFAVLIIPFAQSTPVFGYNGFMAALALSMIMMPTIARTVEVVLRLVPSGLRESALAMGSSKARMVWSVVLPTARSGLATAVVLGIARAVGETAPLLFTAFGYDLMNAQPFDGPQDSLPLFIYKNIRKPSEASIDRGFAGALVLMLVVLALFALARFLGRDRSRSRGRRLGIGRYNRIIDAELAASEADSTAVTHFETPDWSEEGPP